MEACWRFIHDLASLSSMYPQRKLTQLNAGRSDGEINGSRDTNGSQEVNGSLGNPSSAVKNGDDQTESAGEKNATEEPLPEAPRGMARKFWAAL